MKLVNPVFYLATTLFVVSCGSASKVTSLPFQTAEGVSISAPRKELSEEALKVWPHQDLLANGVPGISLDKAYELLKGRKSKTVVVGVIDSGIDINHEDLKDVIWTNPKEIPNNGIDDDKNGYIDDIHGWNFLGDIYEENMEYVRIVRDGNTADPQYAEALKKYEKELGQTQKTLERYSTTSQTLNEADAFLRVKTGKTEYTQDDLATLISSSDEKTAQSAQFVSNLLGYFGSVNEAKESLGEAIKYYETKSKFHLNKELNARKILGDNPNDINNRAYGNNNVIGPNLDGALHGTHVGGIIGAVRNNGLGFNGVADNVALMVVRAVPDGDEYDKDIALAIRYAVDNGAKVINTSFGKGFSPNPKWVRDAIKYAASKDVLIVNAAGNDTNNIDTDITYPDDNVEGEEYANNVITIGALNYEYNQYLLANFTNYGKQNVDIFAPGVQIYATAPGNTYKFLQGTSMASPEVAGIAALIRSYFPKLKATQVKDILIKSGISIAFDVAISGDEANKRPFSELCKSGKIVNAYNAILMAKQMSK